MFPLLISEQEYCQKYRGKKVQPWILFQGALNHKLEGNENYTENLEEKQSEFLRNISANFSLTSHCREKWRSQLRAKKPNTIILFWFTM